MIFVYFGSVFLYQRVNGRPYISKEVFTWDTNLTMISQIVKLKDALEDMYAKIKDDLARLKLSKLIDSQSQGCFRKLEAYYLYVYEHNGYTECSATKLSQFKIIGDIKDSINLIYHLEHENGDEFLPFFYPNPVLPTLYDRIYQQCTSSAKKRKIKEWKDRVTYVTTFKKYRDDRDKCFLLDSRDYCHAEDIWTERLASILKNIYPNVIELTATKKGFAANDVMLTKFPKGVTLKMLLFHGCPDLIINSSPLMLTQGCVETKPQSEFVPYSPSSPIPDKCGQLLACMYQLMMLQYLRQLINGQECIQAKGQGMFIIRKSDVYLFTLSISDCK